MGAHLIDGEFQSDKYPSCPRGKVPLSVKDKTAQDLLWEYSKRRRSVDAEFTVDLQVALLLAGFEDPGSLAPRIGSYDEALALVSQNSVPKNESPLATQLRELLARWDHGEMALGEFEAGVLNLRMPEDVCPTCGGHKITVGG